MVRVGNHFCGEGRRQVNGEFSPAALRELSEALGGNAVVVVDLSSLRWAVQQLVRVAAVMLDAVRNPRASEADELYRRGIAAVSHGWLDDAVQELTQSIAIDRYRAGPHLLLGVAKYQLGDARGAFVSLRDAVKYAQAGEYQEGVTAGLIAANLADAAAAPEVAVEVLQEAEQLGSGSIAVSAALLFRRPRPETQQRYVNWLIGSKGLIPEPSADILGAPLARARQTLDEAIQLHLATARDITVNADGFVSYIEQQQKWARPPVLASTSWRDAAARLPTNLHDIVAVVDQLRTRRSALFAGAEASKDSHSSSIRQIVTQGQQLSKDLKACVDTMVTAANNVSRAAEEIHYDPNAFRGRQYGLLTSHNRDLKALIRHGGSVEPILIHHAEILTQMARTASDRTDVALTTWSRIFPPGPAGLVEPLIDVPLLLESGSDSSQSN
jgi:hypothetical protein